MLTDHALQELLNYASPDPVLSVYLNTDISEGNAETLKLNLRALLKEIDLEKDKEAVLKYFEHERTGTGRSIAMFSSASQDFFRTYPLSVPVHSRVHIAERPYVRPLANILDAYGDYGVALVDKQGARLFYFHMGELVEQEGVLGDEVRQTKRGGASSSVHGRRSSNAPEQTRNSQNIIKRNLKETTEFAMTFFGEKKVRRILIGGTDENVALFKTNLPKQWQSLIVGNLSLSMTANHKEVLEQTITVGAKAEQKREAKLVEQMVTAAAKGAEGVVELAATLNAVREGRVQMLLVDENFHAPGQKCESCGYVSSQQTGSCTFCGGDFIQIPDAAELAVRQVMLAGGEVEIVRDNAEMEKIGIGGLLRY